MSKNRPTLTLNRTPEATMPPPVTPEATLPPQVASVNGDLVDRIFELLRGTLPGGVDLEVAKSAVREEFGGEVTTVHKISPIEKARIRYEVLRQFNGQNATELARKLGISRATVYRLLKQSPSQKP